MPVSSRNAYFLPTYPTRRGAMQVRVVIGYGGASTVVPSPTAIWKAGLCACAPDVQAYMGNKPHYWILASGIRNLGEPL